MDRTEVALAVASTRVRITNFYICIESICCVATKMGYIPIRERLLPNPSNAQVTQQSLPGGFAFGRLPRSMQYLESITP